MLHKSTFHTVTNRRAEGLILSPGSLWFVAIRMEQSWKGYSILLPVLEGAQTCSPLAVATSLPTSSWVQGSVKPVQPATTGFPQCKDPVWERVSH